MADDEKKPQWKTIVETQQRADAALREKLKAARLARDAGLPPSEPKKKARAAAKKPSGP